MIQRELFDLSDKPVKKDKWTHSGFTSLAYKRKVLSLSKYMWDEASAAIGKDLDLAARNLSLSKLAQIESYLVDILDALRKEDYVDADKLRRNLSAMEGNPFVVLANSVLADSGKKEIVVALDQISVLKDRIPFTKGRAQHLIFLLSDCIVLVS